MTHLTSEQIEELVSDPQRRDDHVQSCPLCRQRLDEALAIRHRLRQAFDSVHASALLEHRIVASVRGADQKSRPRGARALLRYIMPSLAAAALMLVAVLLTLYFASPQQAQGAPAELVQIHQFNLMPNAQMHGSSDPAKVAEYLKKELGFIPALPRLGAGMALRGCCVAHFRNRAVGSYVVETDRGLVSIIVLHDNVDSLKLTDATQYQGRAFHTGAFARCKIAAIEADGYTYTAVGEMDANWLAQVLHDLLAEPA